MAYWLVKSDPETYSWKDLVSDKRTSWDGVRNYQARNNLMAMQKGESVLVYESQNPKQVVGIAEVTKTHYPDPTIDDNRWVSVELKAVKSLKNPVTLEKIKANSDLAEIGLIKQSRLSVMQLTEIEYKIILELSK
jgi:predicted RNA-binding protein with PUA-like domain